MLKKLSNDKLAEVIHSKHSYRHFEEFVNRYENMVYRIAYIICDRNEQKSLELATEIFVDLWNKLNSGSFNKPIDMWVKHSAMLYGVNYKHKVNNE